MSVGFSYSLYLVCTIETGEELVLLIFTLLLGTLVVQTPSDRQERDLAFA